MPFSILHFTCLRVFFSTERLKIDPDVRFCWMVTFASLLPKYLGVVLSNRLSIIEFIPIKISLMSVKKVKGTVQCEL